MSFAEKSLQCSDCGAKFTFTAEEQEFFASKGYTNEPKRCWACRNPGPEIMAQRAVEAREFERLCALAELEPE